MANDPADMSDEEFATAMRIQNDYLRKQLGAIAKLPPSRRKKYIDHEIRCVRCGDPVVQVISLEPYRVVRYRRTETEAEVRLDDRWMFFPIADDEPRNEGPDLRVGGVLWSVGGGGPVHRLYSVCRCAQHEFTLPEVLGRTGRTSTTRPTHG